MAMKLLRKNIPTPTGWFSNKVTALTTTDLSAEAGWDLFGLPAV